MKLVGPIQRCNAFGVLVEVALDPLLAAALQFWLSGFCLESEFQSHSKLQSQPAHQFRQTEKIEIMDPEPLHSFSCPPGKPLKPVRVRNLLLQMPGPPPCDSLSSAPPAA